MIVDRCPLTFIIFAIMRIILLYILLALLGQQTTVNGQQTPFLESENLKTLESEKGCEQRTISNETFSETEKSVNISEICGNEKTNHKLVQKKSEKGSEPRTMSHEQRFRKAQSSKLEAQSPSQVFSFSVSQILYFENQIRLADSLYKNYLPQYNFEEVKKAVEFFDSCEPRAMSNEPFSETEKSVNISEIL